MTIPGASQNIPATPFASIEYHGSRTPIDVSLTDMLRNRRMQTLARRVRRYLLFGLLAVVALGILLTLPLRWFNPVTTSFMLRDASGREPVLHEWRSWDELGQWLPLAVVAAEDQRFDQHFGIDFRSLRESITDARDGERARGASTITQQLAKNLYLWPGRSLVRKALEAWLALNLELFLPKRRILELYLNVVELGPGVYGASAASGYFFGKAPAALAVHEAALLAAVLPNPVRLRVDAPSDYVRERQVWVISHSQRLMRQRWLIRIDP